MRKLLYVRRSLAFRTNPFSLLLVLLLLVYGPSAGQNPDLEKKVDAYLNAHLQQGTFSGSVLIAEKGKVLVSKGYGLAKAATNTPNAADTKHRLGSITKQFTATLIMQLQEKGKLRVTDKLSKYLPDYPQGDKITIHHLLTHTSGVPSFTGFEDYSKTMAQPSTLPQLIDRFKQKPLEFEPGSKFNYSNSGYVLLGHIIEKASGQTYESALQNFILKPLRMADSGYEPANPSPEKRAVGYLMIGEKPEVAAPIHMTVPHGAGAMFSSVLDLYKWNLGLKQNKILQQKSLQQMYTPFKGNYGYGWVIDSVFQEKRVQHGGGINGFRTILMHFPEKDLFIVALSNTETYSERIGQDLAAIALGKPYDLPKSRTALQLPQRILDQYVGEYELAPNFILTFTVENGQFFTQATGQPKVEAFAESDSKFFLKVVDAQLTFNKNEKGEVTHVVLHQGGNHVAKKIK